MARRPILEFLTIEQLENIHQASLEVLWKTGVEINHAESLELLRRSGAKIKKDNRVCFPNELVEKSLLELPKEITLYARNDSNDCFLGPDERTYFRCVGGPETLIDLYSDEYRNVTVEDLRQWTKIVDYLSNIDYCMGIYPGGLPLATKDIHILSEMFFNTEKHLHIQPYSADNIEYMFEISTGYRC